MFRRDKDRLLLVGLSLWLTLTSCTLTTGSVIDEFRAKHDDWLKDLEKEGKSPAEMLAAYVDKSVGNLSSLVVLAEADDKRMLLTGDARGDKILEGLELVGALKRVGTMHVDLLKVPHHGSRSSSLPTCSPQCRRRPPSALHPSSCRPICNRCSSSRAS